MEDGTFGSLPPWMKTGKECRGVGTNGRRGNGVNVLLHIDVFVKKYHFSKNNFENLMVPEETEAESRAAQINKNISANPGPTLLPTL